MRYIIDSQHYNASHGPILFYAGNEGGVWGFYNNSGFLVETLARKFGALVVFAEHRFYGKSMPFGNQTFQKENLRFLSVEQVMWDYIDLLNGIKQQYPELKDRATVAFGGSYGGMLAAWLRMKYPSHFQGAIASSAPVRWFKGVIDPNAYTKIASDVIKKLGGSECYDSLQRGFFELRVLEYDQSKWVELDSIFNTCDGISQPADVDNLIGAISDSLGTMAMVNYPYPTDFAGPLPAWPIHAACVAAAAVEPS